MFPERQIVLGMHWEIKASFVDSWTNDLTWVHVIIKIQFKFQFNHDTINREIATTFALTIEYSNIMFTRYFTYWIFFRYPCEILIHICYYQYLLSNSTFCIEIFSSLWKCLSYVKNISMRLRSSDTESMKTAQNYGRNFVALCLFASILPFWTCRNMSLSSKFDSTWESSILINPWIC
jgi:hypothetical protein